MYDFDKRVLFFKIETTEGVDAAPIAADAIVTRNLQPVTLEADTRVREIDGQYFGAKPETKNVIRGRTTFEVEIAGSGTAATAPAWMKLLRIAGMDAGVPAASSVVQSPISSLIPSATLWDYTDRLRQPLLGSRADFRMTFEDDQYPFFSFDVMGFPPAGLWTDATPVVPNVAAFQAPVLANNINTTVMLGGYAIETRRIEFSAGNTLAPRSFINALDRVKYRNRIWTATLVGKLPSLSAKNYFSDVRASTQIPLAVVHGTVAGNIVEVNAPRAEVGLPTLSDEEGDTMISIPLRLIPSATGNDEITITTR